MLKNRQDKLKPARRSLTNAIVLTIIAPLAPLTEQYHRPGFGISRRSKSFGGGDCGGRQQVSVAWQSGSGLPIGIPAPCQLQRVAHRVRKVRDCPLRMRRTSKTDQISFLGHEGELAALIREFDWSKTALGPINTWPSHVKSLTSVALKLRSRYGHVVGSKRCYDLQRRLCDIRRRPAS